MVLLLLPAPSLLQPPRSRLHTVIMATVSMDYALSVRSQQLLVPPRFPSLLLLNLTLRPTRLRPTRAGHSHGDDAGQKDKPAISETSGKYEQHSALASANLSAFSHTIRSMMNSECLRGSMSVLASTHERCTLSGVTAAPPSHGCSFMLTCLQTNLLLARSVCPWWNTGMKAKATPFSHGKSIATRRCAPTCDRDLETGPRYRGPYEVHRETQKTWVQKMLVGVQHNCCWL